MTKIELLTIIGGMLFMFVVGGVTSALLSTLTSRQLTPERINMLIRDNTRLRTALTAERASKEILEERLQRLIDVARAFLRYFNPAVDLPSDKENQWWALHDECDRAVRALSPPPKEKNDGRPG